MGCACKVNQQISYLQKHYGTNPQSKKTHIMENFSLWRFLVVLLALPLMVIAGLFFLPFSRKPIKINKLAKIHG